MFSVLNVGNGLALLGMTTLIGEFFLTYFAKVGPPLALVAQVQWFNTIIFNPVKSRITILQPQVL